MLKSRIAELTNQLARIEKGNPGKDILKVNRKNRDNSNFYIPFNELLALGMHLGRLMREAKTQEKVFELVTTQYELAKIKETKDVNTIQVLDRAIPRDKKSSPKRTLIVILSTVVAFFVAVFLAFFMEYIDLLKNEDEKRYQQLIHGLKFGKSKK